MKTTLTVLTLKKQGILSSVSVHLIRSGLTLIRHETLAAENPDHQRMIFHLETSNPDIDPAALAELAEIDGVVEVESLKTTANEREGHIDPGELQRTLAAAYQEIIQNPASTPAIVTRAEARIGSAQGGRALFALGKQVGSRAYKKDYALGTPPSLGDGVIRMLKPSLEPLAEVASFSDDTLFLTGCPFSHDRTRATSCSFLRGYMQGFLMSSPRCSDIEVGEPECKKTGDFCIFKVH